jgi:hypothetical protein
VTKLAAERYKNLTNYIKRPQNKIKHTNLHVNQSKRKFNPQPRCKTCIKRAHQFNQNKHPPTAIYWNTPLPLYTVMLWFASSQEHDMVTMSFRQSHSKKYSLHAIQAILLETSNRDPFVIFNMSGIHLDHITVNVSRTSISCFAFCRSD